MPEQGFDITNGKGFEITFENGWAVSVQFGSGNYCENRFADGYFYVGRSKNAEIAAYDPAGNYVKLPGNQHEVEGWCSPQEILQHMTWIANQ